ncbi:hypothetical protein EDB86DRAFT_3080710 [Lactarius hatsudake]|nr:hypothetical protein EDB86DRAFT_3080710 [Lactarius hatsudake]
MATIPLWTSLVNGHTPSSTRNFTLLLGGAVLESLRGTVDYTHYSSLSTVEANLGPESLGRGDTNKYVLRLLNSPSRPVTLTPCGMLSNIYFFVADATGYMSPDVSLADIPLTNVTGTIPDPAQRARHHGAGGAAAPAPVNLTAQGKTVLWLAPRVAAESSNPSSGSGNGATGAREGMVGAAALVALLADIAALLLTCGADHTPRFAGSAST